MWTLIYIDNIPTCSMYAVYAYIWGGLGGECRHIPYMECMVYMVSEGLCFLVPNRRRTWWGCRAKRENTTPWPGHTGLRGKTHTKGRRTSRISGVTNQGGTKLNLLVIDSTYLRYVNPLSTLSHVVKQWEWATQRQTPEKKHFQTLSPS